MITLSFQIELQGHITIPDMLSCDSRTRRKLPRVLGMYHQNMRLDAEIVKHTSKPLKSVSHLAICLPTSKFSLHVLFVFCNQVFALLPSEKDGSKRTVQGWRCQKPLPSVLFEVSLPPTWR